MLKRVCLVLLLTLVLSSCARKKPVSDDSWKEVALLDDVARATATLDEEEDWRKYSVLNLFDKNPATCWAVPGGVGVRIYLKIDPGVTSIGLVNGYAKNSGIYQKNNRLKKVHASILLGESREGYVSEIGQSYELTQIGAARDITLKDQMEPQRITLPFDWKAIGKEYGRIQKVKAKAEQDGGGEVFHRYLLCLEILEVFKGTAYDDTCLSETALYPSITKAYSSDAADAIYLDTDSEQGIVLVEDTGLTMEIEGRSADNQWVLVASITVEEAEGNPGRIAPTYALYNTFLRKRVPDDLLGVGPSAYMAIEEEDGITFVLAGDGRFALADVAMRLTATF